MKVWRASFRQYSYRGYCRNIDCVVVAETKEAALGLVVLEYMDTRTEDWTIEEISVDKADVFRIAYNES